MSERIRKYSIRGFTMVEMLVAMAIVGVFFTIFVGVVMATFQTLRTGDERAVAQQNARVAIRFIVKDLKEAVQIAPRRLEEPYDPATLGMPFDGASIDQFDIFSNAYPIFRRTTDGDWDISDTTQGYIDLDHDGSGGEDEDEYADNDFRSDGRPFDIRPLAPNRLELLLNSDSVYSHTQYYGFDQVTGLPGQDFYLDVDNTGATGDNPQALQTRVTYEHQIAPPKAKVYIDEFDNNKKDFQLPLNRATSRGVTLEDDFCLIRSMETEFFDDTLNTDMTVSSELGPDDVRVDSYVFRQPVADHVIDVRFRYWHVMPSSPDPRRWNRPGARPSPYTANTPMVEIRYDPDITHAYTAPDGGTGTSIGTDDGYYRYFTTFGQEIYVWYNYEDGAMVEPVDPLDLINPFSDITPNSFVKLDLATAGWENYESGVLLFEGWRFINMVSVTVRTTNRENLDEYNSTIDHTWVLRDDDEYQVGFVYFGRGDRPNGLFDGFPNPTSPSILNPKYRSVDSYRSNTVNNNGTDAWDFVEPNVNPNYDPGSFVTMEMFVTPPALKAFSDQMENLLTFGFAYKRSFDDP